LKKNSGGPGNFDGAAFLLSLKKRMKLAIDARMISGSGIGTCIFRAKRFSRETSYREIWQVAEQVAGT
jgi:hypothetical protein